MFSPCVGMILFGECQNADMIDKSLHPDSFFYTTAGLISSTKVAIENFLPSEYRLFTIPKSILVLETRWAQFHRNFSKLDSSQFWSSCFSVAIFLILPSKSRFVLIFSWMLDSSFFHRNLESPRSPEVLFIFLINHCIRIDISEELEDCLDPSWS